MAANKISLDICGSHYVVTSSESEEYLQGLAKQLDTDMKEILTKVPSASVASAAIIVALGYLDDLRKSEEGADNMRSQVREYLEDAAQARSENLETGRRLAEAQRQLKLLQDRLGK